MMLSVADICRVQDRAIQREKARLAIKQAALHDAQQRQRERRQQEKEKQDEKRSNRNNISTKQQKPNLKYESNEHITSSKSTNISIESTSSQSPLPCTALLHQLVISEQTNHIIESSIDVITSHSTHDHVTLNDDHVTSLDHIKPTHQQASSGLIDGHSSPISSSDASSHLSQSIIPVVVLSRRVEQRATLPTLKIITMTTRRSTNPPAAYHVDETLKQPKDIVTISNPVPIMSSPALTSLSSLSIEPDISLSARRSRIPGRVIRVPDQPIHNEPIQHIITQHDTNDPSISNNITSLLDDIIPLQSAASTDNMNMQSVDVVSMNQSNSMTFQLPSPISLLSSNVASIALHQTPSYQSTPHLYQPSSLQSTPPPIPARPARPASVNKWLLKAQQSPVGLKLGRPAPECPSSQSHTVSTLVASNVITSSSVVVTQPSSVVPTSVAWADSINMHDTSLDSDNSIGSIYRKKVAELTERANRRRRNQTTQPDSDDTQSVASHSSTIQSATPSTRSMLSTPSSSLSTRSSSRRHTSPSSSTSTFSFSSHSRSNRQHVLNALNFSLLTSRSFLSTRLAVVHCIQQHHAQHFLLLLTRAHTAAFTFKSLFALDVECQRAVQIWPVIEGGMQPSLTPADCSEMLKFDSATKSFNSIGASQMFTPTTDAVVRKKRQRK